MENIKFYLFFAYGWDLVATILKLCFEIAPISLKIRVSSPKLEGEPFFYSSNRPPEPFQKFKMKFFIVRFFLILTNFWSPGLDMNVYVGYKKNSLPFFGWKVDFRGQIWPISKHKSCRLATENYFFTRVVLDRNALRAV